jgi:hypothetical protein
MIDIVKMGLKLILLGVLLPLMAIFINYLIGLIPPLNLSGCMGFYANAWGIPMGFRLLISIVAYGFAVKYVFRFASNYLN